MKRTCASLAAVLALFACYSGALASDAVADQALRNDIPNRARKALPNIIVVLADDMGYGDASVYNPEAAFETPNIDRLASQGTRFLDAHSPSSVCTPTRYAILTGRYAWRTRLASQVLYNYERPHQSLSYQVPADVHYAVKVPIL